MNTSDFKPSHRILIIDDNPSIHADFRKILCPGSTDTTELKGMEAALFDEFPPSVEAISFQLDSAYQGQEGLAMVKQSLVENHPYAMAFIDVRMPPGWDGVETIARIWEVFPQLQIVVCTAYSDYSWEELRLKVGQPDNLLVLKKPFDNVEVQQLAHALTKKWLLGIQANFQLAELEAMVERRTEELSRTNTLLKATEERFSKAFHSSPIPSGIQTLADRRFVDVNERLVTLIGCSREQLLGEVSSDRLLWEQPELVEQWFARLARNEDVHEESAKIRNQSGTVRDVLVSLIPMTLGGQPHLLLLAQDISQRLLLERQLLQSQKMEGIGQLVAGVAHDFNNILGIIQGYAGIIQTRLAEEDPSTKSVRQIFTATERATKLIRQLMMFSRKQVTQFRDIDLNETLANSLALMEHLTGKHIQLDFQPGPNLPAIRADDCMVEQIVMNLFVNARDAMSDGGRIHITTALVSAHRKAMPFDPEDRHGEFACLTFRDTGCGMDEAVLNRIFEPFFTTKAPGKGTGLGLATVLSIIRQHHGWLEVESQLKQGTTFKLYFPTSEKPAEKQTKVNENNLSRGQETILVVEDEESLREMLADLLTMQGYKVLTAGSGCHALEVWEKASRKVDLLVTDMVMPGGIMGGELVKRLLVQKPGLKIIFTSGYNPDIAGKDTSLIEGNNFISKPYSIGRMSQLVRQCLDSQPGS